jgi:hypothetical protein
MKEKRAVDRRAYLIVSDGQPYNAAVIKNIYHRPDFPHAR